MSTSVCLHCGAEVVLRGRSVAEGGFGGWWEPVGVKAPTTTQGRYEAILAMHVHEVEEGELARTLRDRPELVALVEGVAEARQQAIDARAELEAAIAAVTAQEESES